MYFTGNSNISSSQDKYIGATSSIECSNSSIELNATGPIYLDSYFQMKEASLNMNGHKLELALAGEIRNGVITNASEISMPETEGDVSGGLNNVTIETNTVNLYNHLRIAGITTFNGDVIVHDTLTTFGGGYSGGKTLNVNGTLINNGDVFSDEHFLTLNISGGLENNGYFKPRYLYFTGNSNISSSQDKYIGATSSIECSDSSIELNATGPVYLDSYFQMNDASLNMNGYKLELALAGEIRNGVITNVSEISMPDIEGDVSGGLNNVTIETSTVNLYNHLRISGLTTFNGDVIVHDTLTTFEGGYSGGKTLNINGTLINNGNIFDDGNFLTLNLSGDLENNGYFKPRYLNLTNPTSIDIFCDEDKYIESTGEVKIQNVSAQVNALSPLYFGGNVNFNGVNLDMNNHTLNLGATANVSNLKVQNLNEIHGIEGSKFSSNILEFYTDTLVFKGSTKISNGTAKIYGSVQIIDTLVNEANMLEIEGSLINHGQFNNSRVSVTKDVFNSGAFNSSYIYLEGFEERNLQCSGVSGEIYFSDTLKMIGYNVVPRLKRRQQTSEEWAVLQPGGILEFLLPSTTTEITNYGTVFWQQPINGETENNYNFFRSKVKNKQGTEVTSIQVDVSEHQAPFGLDDVVTMRWKMLNFPRKYDDTLAQLVLTYDNEQLNGNVAENLKPYYSNNGGLSWEEITQGVSINTYQQTITINNAPSVGYYVLSDSPFGITELPIEITYTQPIKSGNQGNLLLSVYGQGLYDVQTIKLIHSQDNTTIVADELLAADIGGEVTKGVFTFSGQPLGQYTVQVVNSNDEIVELPNYFTLENYEPAEVEVYLVGKSTTRPNIWTTYTIAYTNKGNIDAKAVPVYLTISEVDDLEIEFLNFQIASHPYLYETPMGTDIDTIVYYVADSALNDLGKARIYPMYIPVIPAGQSGSVHFRVKTNQDIQLQVANQKPLYINPFNAEMASCMVGILASGVIDATAGAIPVVGCINSIASNSFETYMLLDEGESNWGSLARSWFTTFLDCGVNLSGAGAMVKAALTFTLNMKGYIDEFEGCKTGKPSTSLLTVIFSLDPNDKFGPAGFADERYISYPDRLNYTINFENIPAATAAAQRVIVTDEIDDSVFDINSFKFESLGYDTVFFSPKTNDHTFEVYKDMRPELDLILKVEGELNTTNNVVEWRFLSLDPMTLEETDDALLGFLPPNGDNQEGEGFVSFSIKPKDNLSHGTLFKNKASIVFDYNEEIETGIWSNKLDSKAPTGEITLYEIVNDSTAILKWPDAADEGSGIREYFVYISENGEEEMTYLTGTGEKSMTFVGNPGSTYSFTLAGVDSVGNIQQKAMIPNVTFKLEVLDIIELEGNKQIKVYPNPTNSDLNIYIDHEGTFEMELIDLNGRVLKSARLDSGVNTIQLTSVPTGYYLMKIIGNQNVSTIKVIKN